MLLRMRPPAEARAAAAPLSLTATYRDRSLQLFSSSKQVPIPQELLAWEVAPTGADAGAGGESSCREGEECAEGAGANAESAGAVAPLFQSTGVRKAVALARYVDALQSW